MLRGLLCTAEKPHTPSNLGLKVTTSVAHFFCSPAFQTRSTTPRLFFHRPSPLAICATVMLRLPNELLELIFRPLDTRDLWALARVSFRLRSLTLFPFLAWYDISEQQIRSGVLSVPAESAFLIVVAAHIYPPYKLEVRRGGLGTDGPANLPAVLSAVPPIPDVLVHNSYGHFTNRVGMAKVLSAVCRGPTPTLAFIGQGTVRVSRHRNIRPISWKAVPYPTIRTALTLALRYDFLSVLPLVLAYLFCGMVNIGVAAAWLYRHIRRVQWRLEDRIAADLGAVHAHWMHVQTLLTGTDEQFTLVTFASVKDECLTIPHTSALTDTQLSAVLTTAELPLFVQKLIIAEGAIPLLSDVMDCVRRNPHLTELVLKPRAFSAAAVFGLPSAGGGRITALTAPVACIPALLAAEPNVQRVSITFPAGTFNTRTSLRALAALALLPGTHPLALSLSFTKSAITARALPWHFRAPARPLPRVTSLAIFTDGAPGDAVDIVQLARWLAACFPALSRIGAPGAGEDPRVEEELCIFPEDFCTGSCP
ncbi:hypothetical protein FB451DRAFT_1567091 [Mycena latifolia]|nr:hypothetical protein FB451DRAFT_1567091 [Mycena latifolia]